jgi:hypothetical protein
MPAGSYRGFAAGCRWYLLVVPGPGAADRGPTSRTRLTVFRHCAVSRNDHGAPSSRAPGGRGLAGPAYKADRPIIDIISELPILPQKWRDVLMAVMDAIYP